MGYLPQAGRYDGTWMDARVPMMTGERFTPGDMSCGVLSVLAEISIISDGACQLIALLF